MAGKKKKVPKDKRNKEAPKKSSTSDQIAELERELSKTKYNKKTQHHIGLVKAKIADEMISCWTKTGSGKLDPSKGGTWTVSRVDQICLICAEITFSEKFRKKAKEQGYELKGLAYWAATRILPGRKMTLYEAISGKPVTDLKTLAKLKDGDGYKACWHNNRRGSLFSGLTGAGEETRLNRWLTP